MDLPKSDDPRLTFKERRVIQLLELGYTERGIDVLLEKETGSTHALLVRMRELTRKEKSCGQGT